MFYILLFTLASGALSYSISLDSGNKFQNMLVFINDDVSEGDGTLLNNIQNYLENASKSLLLSTNNLDSQKGGVQFGTIHIRVPESWKIKSSYVTWRHCNNAIFLIAKSNSVNDKPFTKQLGKCGSPGNYTRFPDHYFRNATQKEMLQFSKEIMNEFVKLRYGVFTEEPYGNILKVFNGTGFVNSTCGTGVNWEVNRNQMQCTERNAECRYAINENQNHNYSVMFDTKTEQSVFYCDDKYRKHNHLAKNLHNILCNGQSVTSVILQHPDFQENREQNTFENVKFVIVKHQSEKIVFVLDVSFSMHQIIKNMKTATIEYIKRADESVSIGIVVFSSSARILSHLSPMDDQNKNILIDNIKNLATDGSTNIPDGLTKAVEVLNGSLDNYDPVFGTIILLTDGENNRDQDRYDSVIDQIIKKGIILNAIAYGANVDSKLEKLTQGTGDKFSVKESCYESTYQEIKVEEGTLTIPILENIEQRTLAFIDEFVGVNMTINITIPVDFRQYKIVIFSPSKRRFSYDTEIIQKQGVTRTYVFYEEIETGIYTIEIQSDAKFKSERDAKTLHLVYSISSKPQRIGRRLIIPTGDLSTSQIESLTDTTTVIVTVDASTCGILEDEIVKVMLTVVSLSQRVINRNMRDDGLGDDLIAGDNIFTATLYPKDLQEEGFYDSRATVNISSSIRRDTVRRSIQIGSLRILKVNPGSNVDKIPPAKIIDFKLNVPDHKQRVLNVQFLATGNDGVIGNISTYHVNINSNEIIETVIVNIPSGEIVELSVDLSNYNVSNVFNVSLRGVDENNNCGEWSLPQIHSWNYQDIYENYYKEKNSNLCFIILLAVVIVGLSLLFI